MYTLKLVTIVVLASTLNFCYGAVKEDFDLKKIFENMGEEGKKLRDECLKETGISLTDLHDYKKTEDTPEKELCFYKCFFEKIYVLDKDGKVVQTSLEAMEELKNLDENDHKQFVNCLKEVKPVQTCADMINFSKCFKEMFE